MTDLDKMALELLAAEFERSGASAEAVDSLRHADLVSPAIAVSTRAIRTALLTAPPGRKLVPVEPTPEMVGAAREHHEAEAYLPFSLYKAMIAAAPEKKA